MEIKCSNHEHDFRLSAEHGNVQEYVCIRCGQHDVKRGVFGVAFNKKYFGSIINGNTYQWKLFMSAREIRRMSISFPGQPLMEFAFSEDQKEISIVYDSDERQIDEENRKALCDILSAIDFRTWRTDPVVFDQTGYSNYRQNVFFTCTFSDYLSFLSYPDSKDADRLEEFKALITAIAKRYQLVKRSHRDDFEHLTTGIAEETLPEVTAEKDRLHLYDSVNKEEHFIRGMLIRVGRDKECELPILNNNNFISRIHVSFVMKNNEWMLRDEYSKNGSWLNGVRLKPDKLYSLRPGDTIDLGHSIQLLFFVDS